MVNANRHVDELYQGMKLKNPQQLKSFRERKKKNPEKKKLGSNCKTKILTLFGFHKNTPRQGLSRMNLAGK